METVRKPFQGIYNIVRFNWHFYVLIFLLLSAIIVSYNYVPDSLRIILLITGVLGILSTFISLLVSYYVYDVSPLYSLQWLDVAGFAEKGTMVNIHAGFDETSSLLKKRFPAGEFRVFDFYDPAKHTEVSIKRARKAYPAFPGTLTITTDTIPVENDSTDIVFLTLAAHEIRSDEERVVFFRELHRAMKKDGMVIVTEHLRDLPNFFAYNIGFFHFLSRTAWEQTFERSGFEMTQEIKITPFIHVFILQKNGAAS